MKKLFSILFFSILILAIYFVSADLPQQVCKVPQGPVQNSQQPTYPASSILFPVVITSTEAGFLNTACGVATLGAGVERSNVLDYSGAVMSRATIIQTLAQAGQLTSTSAGNFDQYLAGTKTLLGRDPINCYKITIKRINSYNDPTVLTLPAPTIQTSRNIQTVTYKPYNFGVSDIVSALQTVISRGGVGLGGVEYNSAGVDVAAHMFQPVGINPTPIVLPNETRYALKIYDPYFGTTRNVQIAFDNRSRMYSNIWATGGVDRWFHLEELYTIENLGLCSNTTWYYQNNNSNGNSSGGGGGQVITRRQVKGPTTIQYTPAPRGPTTPLGCGLRNAAGNACTITRACPNPAEYCSASSFCTCKSPICGDGEKAPSEQCDDGNTVSGDGCSSTCQTEVQCGIINPTWVSGPIQCNPPGSYCHMGSIITGVCNNACQCTGQIQAV